jgi:Alkylmercury lyase
MTDPNAALPGRPARPANRRLDRMAPVERTAPVERGQRAVQQLVLRSFATTGAPPQQKQLTDVARRFGGDIDQVLADLAAGDYLAFDTGGAIRAAYPFSGVPTVHRVHIDGGADVHAMCAIDALGIAAMLNRDVRIDSIDPHTGSPVTVTITGGRAEWYPSSAVVFAGVRGEGGPSVDTCCSYLNFHTDRASAAAWAAAHPHIQGAILHQSAALALGQATFGPILTAPA